MALPDALLGSALKVYFDQGYTYATGTLVDAKGLAANLTETTPANRPTWDTTSAPSGRGLLSYVGRTGSQRLDGGAIVTLPAWSGSGFWIQFYIIKRGTAVTTLDGEQILDFDGWENHSLSFGKLYHSNSFSDNAITDTNVHYVVCVTNASTNVMTVYIDGVAQADLGSTISGSGGLRTQWLATKFVGNRNNYSVPFNGLIGCIGLAIQATWTTTDTANLYSAMQEWWTTGSGGGGSNDGTLSVTLDAANVTATGTSTVSGTASATLGAATATAIGTSSVTGAGSASLGSATITAAGTSIVGGSASSSLDAATATAAGAPTVTGAASSTLADATLVASGGEPGDAVDGALTVTLDGATLSAAGTSEVSGSAIATIQGATVAAAGTPAVTGSGTTTLDAATTSAAGFTSIVGEALITLGEASVDAAGTLGVVGTAATALEAATATGVGVAEVVGAANVSLESATLTAGDAIVELQCLEVGVRPSTSFTDDVAPCVSVSESAKPIDAIVIQVDACSSLLRTIS